MTFTQANRMFGGATIVTLLSIMPLTGCVTPGEIARDALKDCSKAKQEGQKAINDHFAEAIKCCKDKLPDAPDAYLACMDAVNEAKAQADAGLNRAQAECIAANFTALEQQIKFIMDAVTGIIDLACRPLEAWRNLTQSVDGEMRNISSPITAEEIQIETRGPVMQSLEGSSRIITNQQGRVDLVPFGGGEVISADLRVMLDADLPQRSRDGVVHRLEISGQGIGELTLDPDLPARLVDANGAMRIEAVVFDSDAEDPRSMVISLPFRFRGGTGAISTGWVEADAVTPVAPNAIADWHRDFTVDEFDYAAFLADFAAYRIDLDGDGESTDADIAYFEAIWTEAMDG